MLLEPSRDLVIKKLHDCFPDQGAASNALALLDEYGDEQKEPYRVQLAMIKLSGGRLDTLRDLVATARIDYRDVLAGAEYPEQMRSFASRFNTPEEEIKAIEQRDLDQYQRWLQSDA